jgi:undecaprenyl-diphosphatase
MTVLQAIILGITQGLGEFLPISSSAHLILVPWAFGWHFFLDHPDLNKTFDVALHLGTLLAVLAYFWRDILHLLAAFFRSLARRRIDTSEEKLAWLLLISTIPGAAAGAALETFVENQLGKPYLIAILMILFGLVLWMVDRFAREERNLSSLGGRDALLIGLAQVLALAPGVSRSGITILTGRAQTLDRSAAVRYSFLLSVPIIAGGAALKGLELARQGFPAGMVAPFFFGILSAALVGFGAVWFLMRYVRSHGFGLFVIYRVAVGAAIILAILLGLRHAGGI